MNNSANDSTLRHLRKIHKNWSEDKIKVEAEKILNSYIERNKDKLERLQKQNKVNFDKCVDREFTNLSMDLRR